MVQILHGSATTTHAVRTAIQRSKAPLKELAAQYGLNHKTVAKWRKRAFVHDAAMGPRTPRSFPIRSNPPHFGTEHLVHPSGIEGLIFGLWATLSGERLSCVGPAERPGHGGVEICDELLDPGLQHLLAGEVAAADKLSYQNGKPDFDLIEP